MKELLEVANSIFQGEDFNIIKKDLESEEMIQNQRMFDEVIKICQKHFSEEEILLIRKSYIYAIDLHRGVKRKSGEPYVTHPLHVAYILLNDMHLFDSNSIASAFLHDTIEDTAIERNFLKEHFNEEVATIVEGVSKIKDLDFLNKTAEERYNLAILLKASIKDFRVINLKLADRLHNMSTLIFKGEAELIDSYLHTNKPIKEMPIIANKKQIEKSKETLTLFVPIAERIGAHELARELSDLAYFYLSNNKYRKINNSLSNYVKEHAEEITNIGENIKSTLEQNGIGCTLRFYSKTVYEISRISEQKMSNIPDLISYEIVVNTPEECFLALHYLTRIYKPIGADIKNFISSPKPNGYQAIHSIVTGFENHSIELQICTKQMALRNHYGLAALTELYPCKPIYEIQGELNESDQFIKNLRDIASAAKSFDSFIARVKREALAPQITVYSKDGVSYNFAKGVTALDFAYQIHSRLGDQAIKAIINGIEVELDYELQDNDRVEILRNELQMCPPRDALEFVKTSIARKKIHEALNKERARTLNKEGQILKR